MSGDSEADWEDDACDRIAELGWEYLPGKEVKPGTGERERWEELAIPGRLRQKVAELNPRLTAAAIDEVVGRVLSPASQDPIAENRRVHELITGGVPVVYTDDDGVERNPTAALVDFRDLSRNDYLVVNQVTLRDGQHQRRLDLVLYLNGLPVGIVELKRGDAQYATLEGARQQLATYAKEFPQAFAANAVCLVSDGWTARYGTPFTPFEHWAPWNVDDDGEPVSAEPGELTVENCQLFVALAGLFTPLRFLELLNGCITFSAGDRGLTKRIAKPHQYFAVQRALRRTVQAVRSDGRIGVVWHTQGSGKSMEMELYAHAAMRHPALGNPTILVITDRTDLDDQLYNTVAASSLLPEPLRPATREELRAELDGRATGGIIFTTLQKFGLSKQERDNKRQHPLLNDRRNIIVIVDEAHRSHYGDLDGYARHLRDALPHASFIAFTGTPIAHADRNTRAVFGDLIDVYDLTRAVHDEATVRVYHESRVIDVHLPSDVTKEQIDEQVDEVTDGLDEAERSKMERTVAAMNAVYGAPSRLRELAADIVAHWDQRSAQMRGFLGAPGKAMIVCATRKICADLYDRIVELRPDWHDDAVDRGRIKVVYSGDATDPNPIQRHVRRPSQNKTIEARIRNLDDELELVIVNDMLLTGFDAPPLHTMYMDRPMKGAALMQALARVNRRLAGKRDGLLVGYAPRTENLHKALAEYTATDRQEEPVGQDVEAVAAELRDQHGVICGILQGCPWRETLDDGRPMAYRRATVAVINFLLSATTPGNQVEEGEPNLTERFRRASRHLDRLWALCSTSPSLRDFKDDIAFFKSIRVQLAKLDAERRRAEGKPVPTEIRLYLSQLTAGVIEAGQVTDIYQMAGIERPDLSNLDEAYLARLRDSPHPTLAIEALRNAIQREMRRVTKHNVVRQESFAARLEQLMRRYQVENLSSAQIIAELVELAQQVSAEHDRGKQFDPPLSDAELAFYDAVCSSPSAVEQMAKGTLADIARDLVDSMHRNISVDWWNRSDVQARLRRTIKRLLAKHGYPPEAEEQAIQTVLTQLETSADLWSAEHN
jgi:type I restriction enzyme R subunit